MSPMADASPYISYRPRPPVAMQGFVASSTESCKLKQDALRPFLLGVIKFFPSLLFLIVCFCNDEVFCFFVP